MDYNSPLSLAHQNGRNADRYLKKKAFDKAIECHLNASIFLQEAMTLSTFAKSLESLQLQKNYHLTQTDIIRAKKLQFSIRKQISELKKKKVMEKKRIPEDEKDQELQWAILRAMEEADALLSQLDAKDEPSEESSEAGFAKHPKDDKTVMEELRTVNAQLRSLVTKLLHQLDSSRREIESLRSRLKLYEGQTLPDLAPLELPSFDFSHM